MSTSSVTDRSVPDQWDEVLAVISKDATQAFAEGQIRKLNLDRAGYASSDLVVTVLDKICKRLSKGAPIGDGQSDAVKRYVHVALKNAATDLLAPAQKVDVPVDFVDHGPDGDGEGQLMVPTAPDPDDTEPIDWDAARFVAQARLSPRTPWLAAALLAHLAVDQDPDRTLPPRLRLAQDPAPGQNADWVALQYAGRDSCFAEPDTNTVRKRRSTAIGSLHDALKPILVDAWELPLRYLSEPSVETNR